MTLIKDKQPQASDRRVAVIGLGRFGESAALTLAELGYEVTAVDLNDHKVADVADHVTLAAQGDGTDEALLRSLAIDRSDVGIVGVGNDLEASVLTALLMKKIGIPYVIAKAENPLHGEVLTRVGADRVIYPERSTGVRVAHALLVNHAEDYISLARASGIAKLPLPAHHAGHTASEVCPPGGGLVLLLIRRGKAILPSPDPGEVLLAGDDVVVAGDDDAIEAFAAPLPIPDAPK